MTMLDVLGVLLHLTCHSAEEFVFTRLYHPLQTPWWSWKKHLLSCTGNSGLLQDLTKLCASHLSDTSAVTRGPEQGMDFIHCTSASLTSHQLPRAAWTLHITASFLNLSLFMLWVTHDDGDLLLL